jgi:hypothetical protein
MDKPLVLLSGFSLALVAGSLLFVSGNIGLADIAATISWVLLTVALIISMLGQKKEGRHV